MKDHPLADVLDHSGYEVKAYEDKHRPIPVAELKEVLRFLMGQHHVKQEDLKDCAPRKPYF